MQRRITLLVLFILSLTFAAFAWRSTAPVQASTLHTSPAASILTPQRVPDILSQLAADSHTRTSVATALSGSGAGCVVIYQNGRQIVSNNAQNALIPASTMKLLTASVALDVLGANSTFTTELQSSTKTKNGVLSGSLYLVGGGDPLLETSDYTASLKDHVDVHTSLESLADQLVQAGIHTINGSIIGDDHLFDKQRNIPTWDPGYETQGEVGSIGGLMVNEGFTRFDNVHNISADPTLQAASTFTTILRSKGITVTGTASTGNAAEKASTIASVHSPVLSDIIHEMLTESDNTTAEVLLKDIAAHTQPNGATSAEGVTAVRQSLQKQGIPLDNLVMVDGSGLDRSDRTNCQTVASVLLKGGSGGPLQNGLSKVGETGTLKDRLTGTAAVGHLQGKTGTLNGVSALAGWAEPTGQGPITFAMITNGPAAEKAHSFEDKLGLLLATLPTPPSSVAYAQGLDH